MGRVRYLALLLALCWCSAAAGQDFPPPPQPKPGAEDASQPETQPAAQPEEQPAKQPETQPATQPAAGRSLIAPIRVLLITGQNNHDWQFTSAHYKSFLEQTTRFAVDVTTTPATLLADAAALEPYEVFFLDYNGARWGEAAERNFVDAIKGGKGLVITHASNNPFAGWKEFEEMIGFCWREGAGHGRIHPFDVEVVDYNHPISARLIPFEKHTDELYHGLTRIPAARLRVLMKAHSSIESGGTGKDEPITVVLEYGKGRIFHTTLGHVWPGQPETRASVESPAFKLLIGRGTEWAAGYSTRIRAKNFGTRLQFSIQERPRDPWVFRCALDERPRVVVCALDPRMWVAYDMEHCSLYKVWGGSVNFDGAVYTGAHGPQPTVAGHPYFVAASKISWKMRGELRGRAPLKYRGYHFHRRHVRFKYEGYNELEGVTLLESPEHGDKGLPTLVREIIITGLPEGAELTLPEPESPLLHSVRVSGPQYKRGLIRLGNGRTTITLMFREYEGVE